VRIPGFEERWPAGIAGWLIFRELFSCPACDETGIPKSSPKKRENGVVFTTEAELLYASAGHNQGGSKLVM
jgi:hypothetical protein